MLSRPLTLPKPTICTTGDWYAGALPCEPVVLTTQTANKRLMRLAAKQRFTAVQRYEDWGAEQ